MSTIVYLTPEEFEEIMGFPFEEPLKFKYYLNAAVAFVDDYYTNFPSIDYWNNEMGEECKENIKHGLAIEINYLFTNDILNENYTSGDPKSYQIGRFSMSMSLNKSTTGPDYMSTLASKFFEKCLGFSVVLVDPVGS